MVEVSNSDTDSVLPSPFGVHDRAYLRMLSSFHPKTDFDLSADAFNRYAPIAIFVNIPATIFATGVYEFVLRDSFAIIAKGHNIHAEGEEGLVRHLTKVGTLEQGVSNTILGESNGASFGNGKDVSPV
jgi:hypothetical protein